MLSFLKKERNNLLHTTQAVLTSMYINSFVGFANKTCLNKVIDKTAQIEYIDIESDVEVETNSQENSVRPHTRRPYSLPEICFAR